MTADIVKMFRMIEVNDEHKKYQKIIWHDSPNDPLSVYQIDRVVYGQAAAPFLAIRSMNQCAIVYAAEFLLASKAVLECFYVDDALIGADSVEQAIELRNQLINMLAKGQFKLAKWCSNMPIFDQPEQEIMEIGEPETRSIPQWLLKAETKINADKSKR